LEGLTEGEVTLEGLLRTGEQKASLFVPENHPERNEWYSLDLETMAKLADAQPVVVEVLLGECAYHVWGRERFCYQCYRICCTDTIFMVWMNRHSPTLGQA
jgi:hypothetical protein